MEKKIEIIQSFFITSARYKFTAGEKKVLTQLINLMQPLLQGKILKGRVMQDLFNDYTIEMPISMFLEDKSSKSHKQIWQAFDQLNEKVIYHSDNVYINKKIRLVESPAHLRKGFIRFRLAEELVNIFLDFSKGYSKYELETSLQLKSIYSMRLYELISNQQAPITYKIQTLKEMWSADLPAYKLTHNFIKRVIEPAQKELYDKANWSFEYECIREGKKFTKITFIPINVKKEIDTPKELILRNANLGRILGYIKNTCGATDKQCSSHKKNIELFATYLRSDAENKIKNIWQNARIAEEQGEDPHKYLFGTIKKIVKKYNQS